MPYRLLDCYAGCGVAYAATRAPNITYVGRRSEPGDHTAVALEANRALIGARWNHQIMQRSLWDVADVDIVTGAPAPVRGAAKRHDFLTFAARTNAPFIVLDWGTADSYGPIGELATHLALCAGRRYLVTFVPYEEKALGSPRSRQRCAMVASQVAFGVERLPKEFDWPVAPWGRIRRGRGAALTPAVRGYGPEWVWPAVPDLVGMSPWFTRWVLGWASASLGARPGDIRGELRPEGFRVITEMGHGKYRKPEDT